jgi:oligosaccharide repeat unit polymerase
MLAYLPADRSGTFLYARVLYASTLILVGIYSLYFVPIPSLYHLFAVSYALLFLLQPLVGPWFELQLPESEVFNLYTRLTIGGLLIFSIAYELMSRRSEPVAIFQIRWRRIGVAFWSLLVAYLIALLLVLADAGSLEAITGVTRVQRIEQRGPTTLFAIYVITFSSCLFTLLPLYLERRRLWIAPVVVFLVLAEVLVFLTFRVRTFMLMHFVAAVVGYFLVKPRAIAKPKTGKIRRHKLPRISLTIAAVVIAILGMYVRFSRGLIGTGASLAVSRLSVSDVVRLSMEMGDLGYSPIVYSVLRYVPKEHDFLHGQSYYRLLFAAVPRSIWSDKPPNTERLVASWLRPNLTEGTVPPGVQGDLYINFGLAGVLGFALFGAVLAVVDRQVGLRRYILFSTTATIVFHFVRGGFTNSVLLFATAYLSAIALDQYLTVRSTGKASVGQIPAEWWPRPLLRR